MINNPIEFKDLEQYLGEIKFSTPLSREDEVELSRRILEEGDLEARNELVEANLRFVVTVAGGYQSRGLSMSDLISAGNSGLVTASERFDGTRGFKFISYAVWWIRQSILNDLYKLSTVHIPQSQLSNLRIISKSLNGDLEDLDYSEIADNLDMSEGEVEQALDARNAMRTRSLDGKLFDDEDEDGYKFMPDDNAESPSHSVEISSSRKPIYGLLEILDDRQKDIIVRYFGLDGYGEPETLDTIGVAYDLTRERIRQIKEDAFRELRVGAMAFAKDYANH